MRFWFSHESGVPLPRQLATQVRLAILSGDLRPGDKLPSTRELSRRFAIHPNTISAGFRQLEREGWTELRHGSGVYVSHRTQSAQDAETALDAHIGKFFRSARQEGFSLTALRARLADWLAAPPPDHWLLIDPDPELRAILRTEMTTLCGDKLHETTPRDCTPQHLTRAVPCCRPSQASTVRACLPPGTELVVLPITSANQWLLPRLPAPKNHILAVVSHWPEFLEIARTMFAAAGVSSDALLFRHAREPHWERGLEEASGILCDAFTAKAARLPAGPQLVIFPLLAEGAKAVLRLPQL